MKAGRSYKFGPFRLDARGRLLFRAGERVALTPRAVDILIALIESRGHPLGREELLRRVWADTAVEEGSLTSHISLLRKSLGPAPLGGQYIETLPKRGYRFVAPVEVARERSAHRPSGRIMLAVLPFEDLSSGRTHDYFADGLTEEMISRLGRLSPERLGVIARTSAMHYKGTEKTVHQIGQELNVSHVLEGSVRRVGRRARITAQLIQVRDQAHLWAESYEGDLGDILALQNEVAGAVARQVEVKLAPAARPLRANAPVDPKAHEAYLKGRYLWNRRSLEALQTSIRHFERAIELDPGYAAAYAGLADSYLTLHDGGAHLAPEDATAKAKTAAMEALSIDVNLAEAHTSLGHANFHDLEWAAAGKSLRRAIELNPSYGTGHFYYANYLVAVGRDEEAIAQARIARELDPLSLPAEDNVATVLYYAHRYEEAVETSLRVLDGDPTYSSAHLNLGRASTELGRHREAIVALRKAVALSGRSPEFVAALAYACAVAAKKSEASRLLAELERISKKQYVSAHAFALVFVGLGDRKRAFAWLEKAYRERSSPLPFLRINPRLATLHGDERFNELLRRVGLPKAS